MKPPALPFEPRGFYDGVQVEAAATSEERPYRPDCGAMRVVDGIDI